MTPRHDARLVPAATAGYVAAATVTSGAVGLWWWLAVAVLGVAVTAWAWPHFGAAWLTWAAMVALAVAAAAHGFTLGGGGFSEAAGRGELWFAGVVSGDAHGIEPSPFDGGGQRWRVVLAVDEWSSDGEVFRQTSGDVIVFGGAEWGDLAHGDRVMAAGRVRESSSPNAVGLVYAPELLERAPATGAEALVGRARDGLRAAAEGLPERVQALTVGMTIGDTEGMPASQVAAMRVAGLTHLTAVSGIQFAILALALGAAARALRLQRWLAVVLLGTVMACFVMLVFPQPSVLRAAWMGGVVALALLWGRPAQALPALASGVLGLLLVQPNLALSYGFALSVLATAGIVLWSSPVALALETFLMPVVAKALAVPIAAQVSCFPVLVLLNPGLGPYAVAANLVAAPFGIAVTVLGLAATLVGLVCSPLAQALAWCASLGAWPVAWAADGFAAAPGAWLPWPAGWAGALLAAAVSAALVAATSARRVVAWVRIAGLLIVLVIVAATPPVREVVAEAVRRAPDDWKVAVCDVGQGDMILLRAGPASAVVVDVGPREGGGVACLERHGVREVPLLILTHPHADHVGALREVLAAVPVARAWVSEPGAHEVQEFAAFRVPVEVPSTGTRAELGSVELTVWHRGDPWAVDNAPVNDSSLAAWGEAGGVTFLLLGDLEVAGQGRLASALAGPIKVDVLKAAHHGSASQDPSFLARIVAGVVVVSVGDPNTYGHPTEEALAWYARTGATVLRTDRCGDVDVVRAPELRVATACPLDVAGWGHGTGRNDARRGPPVDRSEARTACHRVRARRTAGQSCR